jgi:hypothetical protein
MSLTITDSHSWNHCSWISFKITCYFKSRFYSISTFIVLLKWFKQLTSFLFIFHFNFSIGIQLIIFPMGVFLYIIYSRSNIFLKMTTSSKDDQLYPIPYHCFFWFLRVSIETFCQWWFLFLLSFNRNQSIPTYYLIPNWIKVECHSLYLFPLELHLDISSHIICSFQDQSDPINDSVSYSQLGFNRFSSQYECNWYRCSIYYHCVLDLQLNWKG